MTYACTEQWTSVIYQLPPFGKVVFLRIRRPLGIWKFNFHDFFGLEHVGDWLRPSS